MNALPRPVHQAVQASAGWLGLGNWEEANAELDALAPEFQTLPKVLGLRIDVFTMAGNHELAIEVSRHLQKRQPDVPAWRIAEAFSVRRCRSLAEARGVLESAQVTFPECATIKFNLACYACQMGEIETSKQYLMEAIRRDKDFRDLAFNDPDLEPLWKSL